MTARTASHELSSLSELERLFGKRPLAVSGTVSLRDHAWLDPRPRMFLFGFAADGGHKSLIRRLGLLTASMAELVTRRFLHVV